MILRPVLPRMKIFVMDPSRLMRMIRFKNTKNLTLDSQLEKDLKLYGPGLALKISRSRKDFKKIFKNEVKSRAILLELFERNLMPFER